MRSGEVIAPGSTVAPRRRRRPAQAPSTVWSCSTRTSRSAEPTRETTSTSPFLRWRTSSSADASRRGAAGGSRRLEVVRVALLAVTKGFGPAVVERPCRSLPTSVRN